MAVVLIIAFIKHQQDSYLYVPQKGLNPLTIQALHIYQEEIMD